MGNNPCSDLLIFVFAFTIFWAILKKMKFFEGSPAVVAVLAFSIAFMIFGFPVIVGFSLTLPLVTFFTHSFVWILVFFIGILIASFFYPDLPKFLAEKFTSRSMIFIGIAIGVTVAVVSGMIAVFWATPPGEGRIKLPLDTVYTSVGVVVFIVVLLIASSVALQKQ